MKPYSQMARDEIAQAVAEARERNRRNQYELVREAEPSLPAWDDLTPEQKARLDEVGRETDRYYDRLGEAIRTGAPLPSPFES